MSYGDDKMMEGFLISSLFFNKNDDDNQYGGYCIGEERHRELEERRKKYEEAIRIRVLNALKSDNEYKDMWRNRIKKDRPHLLLVRICFFGISPLFLFLGAYLNNNYMIFFSFILFMYAMIYVIFRKFYFRGIYPNFYKKWEEKFRSDITINKEYNYY